MLFLSKRLLAFLNLQSGKNDEGLGILTDLLEFARDKDIQEEIKLCLYDIGFAFIKNDQYKQALVYWNELSQLDENYGNTEELLHVMERDFDKSKGSD